MFTERRIKSICFMIVISVLLFGMCPHGVGAGSFFASSSPRSHISAHSTATNKTASAMTRAYGTVIRATADTVTRAEAYTRETSFEYETALSPIQTARRIGMRFNSRDCFFFIAVLDLSLLFLGFTRTDTQHIFDEIVSNTVIISYIHHQDGEKA